MTANFEAGFFVRQPAWHGLGSLIPDYINIETEHGKRVAQQTAGQDWLVEEREVYTNFVKVPGWKSLTRSDTHKVLHIHKESYGVLQNTYLWDLLEVLAAQPKVQVETAGVLDEGRKVWALAKVRGPLALPGDPSPSEQYLCVVNAHDGSMAAAAYETTVRVVCQNTLSASILEAKKQKGFLYSFRHSQKVETRVKEVLALLGEAGRLAGSFQELATELVSADISLAETQAFLESLIPEPVDATERQKDNVADARNTWYEFYQSVTCQGIRGTKWGVLNATTEFLDYGRDRRGSNKADNLFRDVYLGGTAAPKAKALQLLRR